MYLLDGNLLCEAESGLDFLPLVIPLEITDYLSSAGLLSFDIRGTGPHLAVQLERLLGTLCTRGRLSFSNMSTHDTSTPPDAPGITAIAYNPSLLPPWLGARVESWHTNIARRLTGLSCIRVGLHQPGYLRHLGFFAKVAASDVFGSEDSLQFVKQEWQNRQRVSSSGTPCPWLTVPLARSPSRDPISNKRIARYTRWRCRHRNILHARFRRAKCFDEAFPFFAQLYEREWLRLASLCEATTRHLAIALGMSRIPTIRTSAFGIVARKKGFAIVDFLRALLPPGTLSVGDRRAVTYVAGPDSGYLHTEASPGRTFADVILSSGIDIRYQSTLVVPPSTRARYSHDTPAIELLFNEGVTAARQLVRQLPGVEAAQGVV